MRWLRKGTYGVPMKFQDDDLFVGSHASEEVIATSFAMDSGVRKVDCTEYKKRSWKDWA
jgi:hypothetical protein